MMKLSEVREKIDLLDGKISRLLLERLSMVIDASEIKTVIEDKNREADILSRITGDCENEDQVTFLTEVYDRVFVSGKKIMSNHKKKI